MHAVEYALAKPPPVLPLSLIRLVLLGVNSDDPFRIDIFARDLYLHRSWRLCDFSATNPVANVKILEVVCAELWLQTQRPVPQVHAFA
jgi:hypothetical protein